MPTDQQAIKRKAQNTEQKIHGEALAHSQDNAQRKNLYNQRLQEIYQKMKALIHSHEHRKNMPSGNEGK
jgi:uncharacterized FlgJ-related protein